MMVGGLTVGGWWLVVDGGFNALLELFVNFFDFPSSFGLLLTGNRRAKVRAEIQKFYHPVKEL